MQLIALTKGYHTLVDDDMFETLIQFSWFAVETVTGPNSIHVAATRWLDGRSGPGRRAIRMSHQILGILPEELDGKVVDHINRNPLDNQRENLRIITRQENAMNSARVINAAGIYYEKSRNRYKAFKLFGNGKKLYIGTYKTYEEAAIAKALADR